MREIMNIKELERDARVLLQKHSEILELMEDFCERYSTCRLLGEEVRTGLPDENIKRVKLYMDIIRDSQNFYECCVRYAEEYEESVIVNLDLAEQFR